MAASHFLAPGGSFPVRVRDRGLGYRAGVGYGQAERVSAYLRAMSERPRLLVLDLLESYARERNVDVRLERRDDLGRWFCVLRGAGQGFVRGSGGTAREAVRNALARAGVDDHPG